MTREDNKSRVGTYKDVPAPKRSNDLVARRARLRGSVSSSSSTNNAFSVSANQKKIDTSKPSPNLESAPVKEETSTIKPSLDKTAGSTADISMRPIPGQDEHAAKQPSLRKQDPKAPAVVLSGLSGSQPYDAQVLDILGSIDQTMGACAANLANLHKIAGEQTDGLKGLANTLERETFHEFGLNLSSLTESLTAALEPMKAMSELIPAIDHLISVIEKEKKEESETRLSADQLVTNLADQLSSGLIDPFTFKSAYMAVYPTDHPADLLHRLVELLGTQRLSGELFRAAYDAVQVVDMPKGSGGEVVRTQIKVVQDEKLVAELESLKKANEQLKQQVAAAGAGDDPQSQGLLVQKNEELDKARTDLASKNDELKQAQDLLNLRWEEFNKRLQELTDNLQERDEMLEEKDAELAKRTTENQQLKIQMEELRDQTKEMVADLQRQMTGKPEKVEAAKAAPRTDFFEAVPNKPTVGEERVVEKTPVTPAQKETNAQANAQPPARQQQQATPPAVQQQVKQNTSGSYVAASGSYGSGVRAQVFEVIVRQALAGAPWREICAGPMQVNNITPDEVEAEVQRRQALLGKK